MKRPRWRRALFALVALVGVLGAVELGLRASGYADAPVYTPPRLVQIVQQGKYQGTALLATEHRYEAVTLGSGEAGYRTAAGYRREGGGGGSFTGVMRDLSFAAERTEGVSRVFFLGESAVMGLAPAGKQRPGGEAWQTVRLVNNVTAYADRQTIPGMLKSRLEAESKPVEMINAGMVAQDGAAIRGLAAEVLGYQPSALVVYLGNNEEIGLANALRDEQVPVVSAAKSGLHQLRLYRLLANFIVPRAAAPAPTLQRVDRPRLLPTIVEGQWAANPSLWDGEDRRDAVFLGLLRQYREAVAGTVKLAADAGVPLVFLATPPNLGARPLAALHGPGQDRYDALAYWQQGRELDQAGDRDGAEEALLVAQRLDLSHERPPPEFSEIVAELCQPPACRTVNLHESLLARARAEGLVATYEATFGDHEHLTPEGNDWVASQIAPLLVGSL